MNHSPASAVEPKHAASPPVIAISSGKGGVGKTFLSVHLAMRAARLDRRVLLLDADLGLANVDVMLGLTARGTVMDVVQGEKSLQDIIVSVDDRVDVLSGGNGLFELAQISAIQRGVLLHEVNLLSRAYDLILVDTPAGIGENVLFFTSSSESVLIVLTPDPTSLTDAYALIKVLSRQRGVSRFMVALNQADGTTARVTFQRLLAVADRYLDVFLDYVGYMPECAAVRRAIGSQKLLYSCASRVYTDSLNKLLDAVLSRPREPGVGGGLQFFWQQALSSGMNGCEEKGGV